jgi:hypothetical protein
MDESAADQGAGKSSVADGERRRQSHQPLDERGVIRKPVIDGGSDDWNCERMPELFLLTSNDTQRELGRSQCAGAGAEEE